MIVCPVKYNHSARCQIQVFQKKIYRKVLLRSFLQTRGYCCVRIFRQAGSLTKSTFAQSAQDHDFYLSQSNQSKRRMGAGRRMKLWRVSSKRGYFYAILILFLKNVRLNLKTTQFLGCIL